MKAIFVAGTDTGVGKTIVTGLLARYLSEKSRRVVTQKWVQTGIKSSSGDIDMHLKFTGKKRSDFKDFLPSMMPYVFGFPSSPHLAARLERKKIETAKIKESLANLQKDFDFVIIEGTGGVLVPLDEKRLLIDIVKGLALPVLIVAGNKLGAINHTLLSIEALKARNMTILGVIFNNVSKSENRLILKDNPLIVKRFTDIEILGTLHYADNMNILYRQFAPIGERIIARLL